jgi:hypothetical protein
MSISPAMSYTTSIPKRPDLTGTLDQVFQFENFMDHLIGGIRAGTIAALGTVVPGSFSLQYLHAPQLHCNLSGKPIAIVGNCSNKPGEFTMIKIDVASIRVFPLFKDKTKMDAALTHGEDIPEAYLAHTDWSSLEDPVTIVGTLVPNFFVIYFGQDLPHGSIDDDDVMLQIARMGVGYELWAETAKDASDKADDIVAILDKIDDEAGPAMELYRKYLDPNRHENSLPLAKSNGPFGSMTIVPTADFPAAALILKKFFVPEASVPPSSAVFPSGNIMTLQLPGDIDKEAEAKKGLVKLMLFHVRGTIDIDAITVSNVSAAVPSKGMQIIMNQNRASRASSFADLMRMTINEAKAQDWTSIRSSQITIKLLSKALASHMLQGNFATEKVTSLEHETEKIEPSVFLPQKNKSLVDRESTTENRATNENIMDIIDSHKSTRKTAIARIGTMIDITDFSSLCINMDTVISAICTSDEPQPIFRQILMNFVGLVNNPDWAKWTESVGAMPLIHWYCYSFLERIFNCFADFATDFGNGNIISESRSIDELNTKGLINAITAFRAFRTQLQLNQAQMTPIIIMPSSVTAYTINAWNNTQTCPPTGGTPVPASTSPQADRRGDKREPTTPDTSVETKPSGRQQAKKAKKASTKADGPAKDRKEMGMFYLKNPNITPSDVFPKDLPIKLCANFTCKGKECTNANCGFKHPTKASEIPNESIIAIASHFSAKDIGWFNEYHFMKMPDEGVKKLLGNSKGISSKTA